MKCRLHESASSCKRKLPDSHLIPDAAPRAPIRNLEIVAKGLARLRVAAFRGAPE